MTTPLDIGTCSAIVNLVASLCALYVMQAATCGRRELTTRGVVRELHRLALALLSLALFVNAGATLSDGSDPRPVDLIVNFALLAVLAASVWRFAIKPRRHAALAR